MWLPISGIQLQPTIRSHWSISTLHNNKWKIKRLTHEINLRKLQWLWLYQLLPEKKNTVKIYLEAHSSRWRHNEALASWLTVRRQSTKNNRLSMITKYRSNSSSILSSQFGYLPRYWSQQKLHQHTARSRGLEKRIRSLLWTRLQI